MSKHHKPAPTYQQTHAALHAEDVDALAAESAIASPGLISQETVTALEEKLTAAEQKAQQLEDQRLRLQAELQNLHARAEKDRQNAYKYGLEKFLNALLPVADSLERALQVDIGDNAMAKNVHQGVELTQGQLLAVLTKFNITVLAPELGAAFNPSEHQAISAQPDPAAKPNTILQVLQKGYLLEDRLLRPALVIVAKSAEGSA